MNHVEDSAPSAGQASSSTSGHNNSSKFLVHNALEANKRLQKILTQRAEQLEAKLKEVDQLLIAATVEESQDEPESEISIPGAKKATGLIPSAEFLSPGSPFYEEATKRSNYVNNITPHSLKAKDIEVLTTAVRHENERLQAYKTSHLQDNTAAYAEIDLQNNLEGLDWNRIAEKVSDASSVKRTAVDCRIAWIADKHPSVNHSEWSEDELKSLQTLVSQHTKDKKTVDWVKVAEKLGTNRTPIACMKQMLPRNRHTWTEEADEKLFHAVETCGYDNWQLVAKKVSEYVSAVQCHNRWQKTLNPTLRRGAWTEEEDERLRKVVAIYGTSWIQVATFVAGRTNDQCRERWMEHVNNSSAKVVWTPEEDKLLLDLVKERGNQWKSISLTIGNDKTGQSCRLRYNKFKRLETNPQNNSLSSLPTAITNHGSSQSIGRVDSTAQDSPTNSLSTNMPEFFSHPENDLIISTVASSTSDLNGKRKNKVAEEPSQAIESSQGEHSGTASDVHTTVDKIDSVSKEMGTIPGASGSTLAKDNKPKPRPRPRPKRPTKGASSDSPPPTIAPENSTDLNTLPGTSGTPETQETMLIPPLHGTRNSTGLKRKVPEVPDNEEASKSKRCKRLKTINDSSNTMSQQDILQPKARGRHGKSKQSRSTELEQPVAPTGGASVPPMRRQSSRLLACGKQ